MYTSSANKSDNSPEQWSSNEDLNRREADAWTILDHEIFEWQNICETGPPYWWAPEPKYGNLRSLQTHIWDEGNHQIWNRDISKRSGGPRDQRLQAISEDFVQDVEATHELAHLVAIQLLWSYFTLPPGHVAGAPNHSIWDGKKLALPYPRILISSLRMHSHFPYPPSFGHQARNVTPMAVGMSTLDGTSPNLSCPAMMLSNVIILSPAKPRRTRIRRKVIRRNSSDSISEGVASVYTDRISSSAQEQCQSAAVPQTEIHASHYPPSFAVQNPSQDESGWSSNTESLHEATRGFHPSQSTDFSL